MLFNQLTAERLGELLSTIEEAYRSEDQKLINVTMPGINARRKKLPHQGPPTILPHDAWLTELLEDEIRMAADCMEQLGFGFDGKSLLRHFEEYKRGASEFRHGEVNILSGKSFSGDLVGPHSRQFNRALFGRFTVEDILKRVRSAKSLLKQYSHAHDDEVGGKPTDYALYRDGDGFRIAGFGEDGALRNLKGFETIRRLVSTPSTPVSVYELTGAHRDERLAHDRPSHQPMMDDKARDQIRLKRAELQEELEDSLVNHDGRDDGIRTEIQKLDEHVIKTTGLGGRSRSMPTQADSSRSTISANISRAKEALKQANMPRLAEHFDRSISCESGSFVYQPAGLNIQWQTEKSEK